MNITRKSILAAAAVTVIVAIGAWWRMASETRAEVAASLPHVADVTPLSEEARRGIAAAEHRAHSLFTARRGLADLSRYYHANGMLEAAVRCYEGLEQLEPSEARWPHRHATILAGFGEIEPALALWRRVAELAPDYELARLRIGDALLKTNQTAEAAAAYAGVLKLNPQNPYAELGLARIDLEAGRWDSARDRLEKIVAQTNYELGYDLIVSLYERTGQQERAAAIRGTKKASGAYRDPADPWMDELLDFCYDPYRLSVAAGTLARESSGRSAQLLERAIALAPEDIGARFQLAMLCMQQKNFETARQQLERCTAIVPDFSDGWAQLSGLQVQLGEKAAADRTLETGLQHCPNSPGLHLMKARNLKQADRLDESIREYKVSARLRPNEADAYLELGNLLIGLGRTDEGVEQLEAAYKAEPGNPMAIAILAFNAVVQGDEVNARQWYARVKAQPRVAAEQLDQLTHAFQQQFGKSP